MNMHNANNIADTDTVDTVDTVNTIDTVDTVNTVNICTPLDAHRARHGVLSLQCIDWCGKINLRGDIDNAQFAETVQQICGIDAPQSAGEVAVGEQCTLFWLAPDEWLIHCPLAQTKPLLDQLECASASTAFCRDRNQRLLCCAGTQRRGCRRRIGARLPVGFASVQFRARTMRTNSIRQCIGVVVQTGRCAVLYSSALEFCRICLGISQLCHRFIGCLSLCLVQCNVTFYNVKCTLINK